MLLFISHTIHTHTDEHLPTEPHNMQCAVCLEEGQMAEYALFACCHVFCPHCTNQLAVRCLVCPVCRCPNGGVSNQQQEQNDVGAFLSNAIDAVHVSSESPQAMGDYDAELEDVLGHAFAIASSMTQPHSSRYTVPGGGRLVSTPPPSTRPSAPPPTRVPLPHGDVLEAANTFFRALDTVSPTEFATRLRAVTESPNF